MKKNHTNETNVSRILLKSRADLPLDRRRAESPEYLYSIILLALWSKLHKSKKHKAYYLFSILSSESYWYTDTLSMVREAVCDNTLNLLSEMYLPEDKYYDNIYIYFLEDEQGQYFIVLVLKTPKNPYEDILLDIIPVKRNDYQMTQIFPIQKQLVHI